MEHVTHSDTSLLSGDTVADVLMGHATLLGKADGTDSSTIDAIGVDGNEAAGTFLLNSGTILPAGTTTTTATSPTTRTLSPNSRTASTPYDVHPDARQTDAAPGVDSEY